MALSRYFSGTATRKWVSCILRTVSITMLNLRQILHISSIQTVLGAGALVSPLSATHFAQVPNWSHHYLITLALGIVNGLALALIFQLKDQDSKYKVDLLEHRGTGGCPNIDNHLGIFYS